MHSRRFLHCVLFASLFSFVLFSNGCGSGSDNAPPDASIKDGSKSNKSGNSDDADEGSVRPVQLVPDAAKSNGPAQVEEDLHPRVIVKTTAGQFVVELDMEKAPRTVLNFLDNYVDRGFYQQTVFHHVEAEFMVAGGGYNNDMESKATRPPVLNEADNGLSNKKGTIAMTRDAEYSNSATSQFFINLSDNEFLDHKEAEDGEITGYCVFGNVVEGMDVVKKIAQKKVTEKTHEDGTVFPNWPVKPVVILSVHREVPSKR